ncbi:hypothetical protein DFH08DRAFT_952250 [Mycena albidolilacea]|uniref:Uncharacterized protein n=1 Tax=Mycena albidolilacea TaxID=1033008 RepID=A0AAD7F0F9_9AGAR|nr:hypothetical protein DFH08DRAFT_952250 [Mycena albidolilacea]
MLLVQKPTAMFSMSPAQSPIHYHRRHPSAPVVQVQPTRTPGLLTLSKPPRPTKASPRPKAAQAVQRSPKPAPAPAQQQAPVAEPRGRQHQQNNNNHGSSNSNNTTSNNNKRRSASTTAPARRRQPSPDPFAPQPSAAPPPSTNKRRHNATNPIPVPASKSAHAPSLSHSDPVLSHMPRRRQPQRTTTLDSASFTPYEFPICDDTATDAGSRPSTPSPPSPTTARRPKPALHLSDPRTPTRKIRLPDPPRTAPLSSISPGSFPFPPTANTTNGGTPSPPSPKRRADRRAKHLSEGVVLPPLFPFVFPRGEQDFAQAALESSQRRSQSSEREAPNANGNGMIGNGLFASSMFQNSPSPEELPPPLFS